MVEQKPLQNICSTCSLANNIYVPPEYINNNKEETICIVGEAPGETEAKYGKPFIGKSGKIIRPFISNIKKYNVLIINSVNCRPDNNKTPSIKQIRHCLDINKNFVNQYKPIRFILLGRAAVEWFERFYNVKLLDKGIEQLTKLGLQKLDRYNVEYIAAYHPSAYLRSRDQNIFDVIKNAFIIAGEIDENSVSLNLAQYGKYLNTLTNTPLKELTFNLKANKNDLLLITKGRDKYYHLFIDENNNKKIIKVKPSIIFDDIKITDISQINYLIFKKYRRLLYTDDKDIGYLLRDLSDQGIYFNLFMIDAYNNIVNHLALIQTYSENLDFRVYKPHYLDIEIVNDDIVLATIVDKNGNYIVFSKKKPTKKDDNVIVTDNVANDTLEYLKKNAIIVTGWNVYFDIINILSRATNTEIEDLVIRLDDYQGNVDPQHICNYPYFTILDLMQLYKKFVEPNAFKYSLDYVAYKELGKRKILTAKGFEYMYENEFDKLLEYNILDTILVKELDDKLQITDLVQQMRIAVKTILDLNMLSPTRVGQLIFMREALKNNQIISFSAPKSKNPTSYSGGFVQLPSKIIIKDK